MAAYLGYTLRMKTLFCGWPVMVHDMHTRRRWQQLTWLIHNNNTSTLCCWRHFTDDTIYWQQINGETNYSSCATRMIEYSFLAARLSFTFDVHIYFMANKLYCCCCCLNDIKPRERQRQHSEMKVPKFCNYQSLISAPVSDVTERDYGYLPIWVLFVISFCDSTIHIFNVQLFTAGIDETGHHQSWDYGLDRCGQDPRIAIGLPVCRLIWFNYIQWRWMTRHIVRVQVWFNI